VDPNVPGPRVAAAKLLSEYDVSSKDATRMRWGAALPELRNETPLTDSLWHQIAAGFAFGPCGASREVVARLSEPIRCDSGDGVGSIQRSRDVHVLYERIREAAPFSPVRIGTSRGSRSRGACAQRQFFSLGWKTLLLY
jgi:hypothetical protein